MTRRSQVILQVLTEFQPGVIGSHMDSHR
jgi:hypothetical protein